MPDGSTAPRRPSHGMPLWTFLFAASDAPLQSARVVAPDRAKAIIMMAGLLGANMSVTPGTSPASEVIVQCSGRLDELEARVVSIITRDGRFIEAAR